MTTLLEKSTQYSSASLKEVSLLSFSFILVLFSASLMGLCDRLILAHYSIEGLEAGITALWLSQLFQIPIIRATSMTQAFVGQYKGSGQQHLIGPCVWQMIWLSLLTMVITLPLSGPIGTFFFHQTAVQEGKTCFYYLTAFNFLFPLGAALSAFYLGQGQAKKILSISLISHGLHILLDILLVFGGLGIFPPLGAVGSMIASIISQLFFCLFLFFDFVHPKHFSYETRRYAFKWELFWKYTRIGTPRAIAKLVQLAAWVAATRIMISKGNDYAAILAFGGSLQLFLNCFNEGLSQALTTMGAYLIGAQKPLIQKLIRSACLFLSLEWLVLAIPFLFFPDLLIHLFFKQEPSAVLRASLTAASGYLWLLFLMEGLNMIGFGLLSAYGDTVFQMRFSLSAWPLFFFPTYFIIDRGNSAPELFWLISSMSCLIPAAVYFIRLGANKLKTNHILASPDLPG